MLGTNDCQRHGPARGAARRAGRLTPQRGGDRRGGSRPRALASYGSRRRPSTTPRSPRATGDRPFDIRAADVRRLSAGLLAFGLEVVDAGSAVTAAALATDGVHPSVAGQTAIARRAVTALAHPRDR